MAGTWSFWKQSRILRERAGDSGTPSSPGSKEPSRVTRNTLRRSSTWEQVWSALSGPHKEHTTGTTQCLPQSWRRCQKTGLPIGPDRSLDGYFKLAGSLDIDRLEGAVAVYSSIARELGLPEKQSMKSNKSNLFILS